MRPAPGPIPDVMPSIEDATKNITFLMDIPRPQLGGYAISQLVNEYSDGTPKWLTGSTVWLPAVFGEVDKNTDLDIVFQTKNALDIFIHGVEASLPGYTVTQNGNQGKRVIHPNGEHVIDAWHLETDESIAELLMAFPNPYQRCAFFMTWTGSSLGYLTRIVKDRPRFRRVETILDGGVRVVLGGYGR